MEREWIETDDDCAPFCGCLRTGEIEDLYRLTANCRIYVFYISSMPMVLPSKFLMNRLIPILKTMEYQHPKYGSHEINAEAETNESADSGNADLQYGKE